jgi:hypothetical protein
MVIFSSSFCLRSRNTTVMIAKLAEDDLLVMEDGYFKKKFRVKRKT